MRYDHESSRARLALTEPPDVLRLALTDVRLGMDHRTPSASPMTSCLGRVQSSQRVAQTNPSRPSAGLAQVRKPIDD
jgi:hypothetical protein